MSGRKSAAEEERPRGWSFWRRLLTHRNVVALCLMYMPNSFIFYFCLTWLPEYLRDRPQDGRPDAGLLHRSAADAERGCRSSGRADDRPGRAAFWASIRPRRSGIRLVHLAALGMFLAAASGSAMAAATFFALGTAANMFSSDRPGAPARTSAAGTPEWSAPR